MNNSKLTRTLRILNTKELKRLLQFLKSPFYNFNPSIVKLYMLLRTHHPDFSSPKLTKEKVFKKVFPARKYEHQKMLNLMSDFTALLEKYLMILQLEKEELEQKKLLVRSYSERPDCYDVFVKKNREIEKIIDELPYRDERYFREKKELNLQYFGHPGTDMHTDGKDALKNAVENFKAYQVFTEVKLKCALNAWENTVGGKKTIGGMKDDLVFESKVYLFYEKLIKLQMMTDGENVLPDLTSEYLENNQYFRDADQANILKILLNYSNRYVNQGKTDFAEISFNLYKVGLENKCLLIQGKLKESIFHSVVTAGTLNKAFDWTNSFIEDYNCLLDVKVREDALSLGKAQLFFGKGEFEKVVDVLQYSFREPQDIFKSKLLLIRSWFEIFQKDDSYYDLLMTQLENFEKYTRRNKAVSSRLAEGVLNFISMSKKIVGKKLEGKNTDGVRQEIAEVPNLVYRHWLLTKLK